MVTLRARVSNRLLILDEPTELPEGTVVELVIADDGDDLDEAERARLHAAVSTAWSSLRAGQRICAEDVIREIQPGDA